MNTCAHPYYASTSCLHGEHTYCAAHTGLSGAKKPARCKFCGRLCACTCHTGDPHPHLPPDPALTELRHQLDTAARALDQCAAYLARQAEANAALHCSADAVMYPPLHSVATAAAAHAHALLQRTTPPPSPQTSIPHPSPPRDDD